MDAVAVRHARSAQLKRMCRNRFKKKPLVPQAAHWGWSHLPLAAKLLILGVLCGLISVTTPFWASLKTDYVGYATYGLWHFCRGERCTSMHDNILEGKSIPVWYHMVQGSMCIGVACSIISLAMLTNSLEGKTLKMTATVHRACACILGIAALEHFMGLYVFVIYLEETDFLSDRMMSTYELDFHGSFYSGIVSFVCSLVAALVVYTDDTISKADKVSQAVFISDADLYDYYQHEYLLNEYGLMMNSSYADIVNQNDGFVNDGFVNTAYEDDSQFESS